MNNWNEILNNNEELSEQELLEYLQGTASEETRFSVENTMANTDFLKDAVEGLQQFKHSAKLTEIKNQLNHDLLKITRKKSARKKSSTLTNQQWVILSIMVILFLCVMGYGLIQFYLK